MKQRGCVNLDKMHSVCLDSGCHPLGRLDMFFPHRGRFRSEFTGPAGSTAGGRPRVNRKKNRKKGEETFKNPLKLEATASHLTLVRPRSQICAGQHNLPHGWSLGTGDPSGGTVLLH